MSKEGLLAFWFLMWILWRVLCTLVGILFIPGALSFGDRFSACSISAYDSSSFRERLLVSLICGKSFKVSLIVVSLVFPGGVRSMFCISWKGKKGGHTMTPFPGSRRCR